MPDGRYAAELSGLEGQSFQCKFTRGSWQTVEKASDGSEITNRRLTANVGILATQIYSWADDSPASKPVSQRTGDLRIHENIGDANIPARRVWVWLPPGYNASTDRYPVFYLQDGQNLFDAATSFAGEWHADETAQQLVESKQIRPIILVGIDNGGEKRLPELTPTAYEKHPDGGHADDYLAFLLRTVKPLIDSTYRTLPDRDHTAVGGSSLGGLFSLYAISKHDDAFGSAALISPSLWWDEEKLLKSITARDAWLKHSRLWIDMGTAEEADATNAKQLVNHVRLLAILCSQAGLEPGKGYELRVVENAGHNEAAWSARFGDVLKFLYPPEAK